MRRPIGRAWTQKHIEELIDERLQGPVGVRRTQSRLTAQQVQIALQAAEEDDDA